MAKASASPLLFILFFISAAGKLAGTNAQKSWCVAKPSTDENVLAANIQFACSDAGVDCNPINYGGPCYYPNSTIHHASVAMNLYYQVYISKGPASCYFSGSGLMTITDPSYGNCKYE